MNHCFSRVLTLLRKERGLSQKSVANSLGISQALLSHYEKGIRECRLDFVVKCAEFYNVSCDYLLGRSAERTGATISVDEIPDSDRENNKKYMSFNMMLMLNKKLISNSLTIIFDMLSKCNNIKMIMEISYFIMIAIYRVFRVLHLSGEKNNESMFNLPEIVFDRYADASMKICEAKAVSIAKNKPINDLEKIGDDKSAFEMTTQSIHDNYPSLSSSLFNLVKNVEKKIDDTICK